MPVAISHPWVSALNLGRHRKGHDGVSSGLGGEEEEEEEEEEGRSQVVVQLFNGSIFIFHKKKRSPWFEDDHTQKNISHSWPKTPWIPQQRRGSTLEHEGGVRGTSPRRRVSAAR